MANAQSEPANATGSVLVQATCSLAVVQYAQSFCGWYYGIAIVTNDYLYWANRFRWVEELAPVAPQETAIEPQALPFAEEQVRNKWES